MADPEQVAARYVDTARRRRRAARGWLDERGRGQEPARRRTQPGRGDCRTVRTPHRGRRIGCVVDEFDAQHRSRAVERAENLPEGTPIAQVVEQLLDEWGDSRYINDAQSALSERQKREREAREDRSRGGIGYDF